MSQLCSQCHQPTLVRDATTRVWECESCGYSRRPPRAALAGVERVREELHRHKPWTDQETEGDEA